jgi:hypothetical protein
VADWFPLASIIGGTVTSLFTSTLKYLEEIKKISAAGSQKLGIRLIFFLTVMSILLVFNQQEARNLKKVFEKKNEINDSIRMPVFENLDSTKSVLSKQIDANNKLQDVMKFQISTLENLTGGKNKPMIKYYFYPV